MTEESEALEVVFNEEARHHLLKAQAETTLQYRTLASLSKTDRARRQQSLGFLLIYPTGILGLLLLAYPAGLRADGPLETAGRIVGAIILFVCWLVWYYLGRRVADAKTQDLKTSSAVREERARADRAEGTLKMVAEDLGGEDSDDAIDDGASPSIQTPPDDSDNAVEHDQPNAEVSEGSPAPELENDGKIGPIKIKVQGKQLRPETRAQLVESLRLIEQRQAADNAPVSGPPKSKGRGDADASHAAATPVEAWLEEQFRAEEVEAAQGRARDAWRRWHAGIGGSSERDAQRRRMELDMEVSLPPELRRSGYRDPAGLSEREKFERKRTKYLLDRADYLLAKDAELRAREDARPDDLPGSDGMSETAQSDRPKSTD